jgi:hypothetical protein
MKATPITSRRNGPEMYSVSSMIELSAYRSSGMKSGAVGVTTVNLR